jgi:hypothetical protein
MAEEAAETLETIVAEGEARTAELALTREDQMTAPQLLDLGGLESARQLLRIVSQPLDFDNLRQLRLIGDMALGTLKLNVRVAEDKFRAKKDGALAQLLAEIAEEARAHLKSEGMRNARETAVDEEK